MMTACGKVGTQRFDTKRVQSANLVSGSNECNGGREMQSFLGTLRKAPGYVALIIAVAMSTTAALTAAIVFQAWSVASKNSNPTSRGRRPSSLS
jgi:hypothetical protein